MLKRVRHRKLGLGHVYIIILLLAVAVALTAKPENILHKYDVCYVVVDIRRDNLEVVPVLARGIGGESVESLISRTKPVAAIAGTYFDQDFKPLGDLVSHGSVICRGCQKQAIGFTPSGETVFLKRKNGQKLRWNGIESGVACGPRLLKNGKLDIDCRRDGFSKAANTLLATRCAIGSDIRGNLVMCAVPTRINLNVLAEIMLKLGAVDAINLDGGRSCFLYANGRIQQNTGCAMSNVITIQKRLRL